MVPPTVADNVTGAPGHEFIFGPADNVELSTCTVTTSLPAHPPLDILTL